MYCWLIHGATDRSIQEMRVREEISDVITYARQANR